MGSFCQIEKDNLSKKENIYVDLKNVKIFSDKMLPKVIKKLARQKMSLILVKRCEAFCLRHTFIKTVNILDIYSQYKPFQEKKLENAWSQTF